MGAPILLLFWVLSMLESVIATSSPKGFVGNTSLERELVNLPRRNAVLTLRIGSEVEWISRFYLHLSLSLPK